MFYISEEYQLPSFTYLAEALVGDDIFAVPGNTSDNTSIMDFDVQGDGGPEAVSDFNPIIPATSNTPEPLEPVMVSTCQTLDQAHVGEVLIVSGKTSNKKRSRLSNETPPPIAAKRQNAIKPVDDVRWDDFRRMKNAEKMGQRYQKEGMGIVNGITFAHHTSERKTWTGRLYHV
ncbi:hypothetical protein J6590_096443 [Homalodisca vitripennis]|nr:hypothetical protein J6590_096443 [Homalodisca vitripennis]